MNYFHLIWILPLLLFAIIVAGTSWRPRWGWVIGLAAIGLVILGGWWFFNHPKQPSTTSAASAPATPAPHNSREKRTYRFSDFPDGVIRVEIHPGEVDFYPKGGKIHIVPPTPAVPWNDEPGTAMPRVARPPGMYTITHIDPNAWGVDIWN